MKEIVFSMAGLKIILESVFLLIVMIITIVVVLTLAKLVLWGLFFLVGKTIPKKLIPTEESIQKESGQRKLSNADLFNIFLAVLFAVIAGLFIYRLLLGK